MSALIDSKAAAELLGVPETWVRRQARENAIPHVRLGRYVRFDPATIEAWWRARQQGPQVDMRADAA